MYFAVVTIYATLGDDAIAHGINETEVTTVITSHDLLPKFKQILAITPRVNTIIYMEDQLKTTETDGYKEGVRILPFQEVISLGSKSKIGTPSSCCIYFTYCNIYLPQRELLQVPKTPPSSCTPAGPPGYLKEWSSPTGTSWQPWKHSLTQSPSTKTISSSVFSLSLMSSNFWLRAFACLLEFLSDIRLRWLW